MITYSAPATTPPKSLTLTVELLASVNLSGVLTLIRSKPVALPSMSRMEVSSAKPFMVSVPTLAPGAMWPPGTTLTLERMLPVPWRVAPALTVMSPPPLSEPLTRKMPALSVVVPL